MKNEYDDIIHLPHPTSKVHPRMSMHQRAAQFAPFAALVGHETMIAETARYTDDEKELGDERNKLLNLKMKLIYEHFSERPSLTITYFKADTLKNGGTYHTTKGTIKKIDEYENIIIMDSGIIIPTHTIFDINGELFNEL